MISIILFVTFNAMKDYITTTAAMNNQAVNFDLVVYLNGENERNTEFVNQVIALPEVLAYSQVRCLYGENLVPREQITGQAYRVLEEVNGLHLENDRQFRQVNLCAFGPSEFERYARSLGLDPQDFVDPQHPSAILMNRAQIRDDKLYEFDFYDISVGESLEVTFTQPGENMQTVDYPVEIGAIAGDLPLGAYQPSWETLLIVSDVVFDSTVERLDPSVMSMGSLFFKASDAQALTGEVKQRYSAIVGESLAYMSVFENNQQEAMMELMVNLFFYGFLTLITLVGVTNIINTIDTNLQLRRREFAMLKSVGLTPRGFRRILNFESLFYGLTSLLCGLPIAILFSIFLYYQLGGISSFSFTLPWRPMLVCTAGVLLIVLTTMLISGARIGKDNIVDTIRAENL
jgi:putative ABC transport system permease protein